MLDDGFEQAGDVCDLATLAERLPCRFDGVQHGPAAADQQRLGHGEMEKADLLSDAMQSANKVGKDAIDAGLLHMPLLMLVGGNEELPGRGGKIGDGPQ